MIRLKNIGNGWRRLPGKWTMKNRQIQRAATTYRFENTELNKLNSSWKNPVGKFNPVIEVFVFM